MVAGRHNKQIRKLKTYYSQQTSCFWVSAGDWLSASVIKLSNLLSLTFPELLKYSPRPAHIGLGLDITPP